MLSVNAHHLGYAGRLSNILSNHLLPDGAYIMTAAIKLALSGIVLQFSSYLNINFLYSQVQSLTPHWKSQASKTMGNSKNSCTYGGGTFCKFLKRVYFYIINLFYYMIIIQEASQDAIQVQDKES